MASDFSGRWSMMCQDPQLSQQWEQTPINRSGKSSPGWSRSRRSSQLRQAIEENPSGPGRNSVAFIGIWIVRTVDSGMIRPIGPR
jgi:hypothetical protein